MLFRSANAVAKGAVNTSAVQLPKPIRLVNADPQELAANLQKVVEQMTELMKDGGRGVEFRVDSALGRPVLVVTNQETGELIRQLPGEDVVRIAHSIEKLKGLLLNKSI